MTFLVFKNLDYQGVMCWEFEKVICHLSFLHFHYFLLHEAGCAWRKKRMWQRGGCHILGKVNMNRRFFLLGVACVYA